MSEVLSLEDEARDITEHLIENQRYLRSQRAMYEEITGGNPETAETDYLVNEHLVPQIERLTDHRERLTKSLGEVILAMELPETTPAAS